jgi:hypothetical protein
MPELYNNIHFDNQLDIIYCSNTMSSHVLIDHKTGMTHDSSLIDKMLFKSKFGTIYRIIYFDNKIILTLYGNYILKYNLIYREYMYEKMIYVGGHYMASCEYNNRIYICTHYKPDTYHIVMYDLRDLTEINIFTTAISKQII